MNKVDEAALLERMYPDFFETDNIKNRPDECICDEMILSLDEFEPDVYSKKLDDDVSFGYFEGNLEDLKKEVEKVGYQSSVKWNKNGIMR